MGVLKDGRAYARSDGGFPLKKFYAFAGAAVLALGMAGSVLPAAAKDDPNQTAIQAVYDATCTALKAGDVDTAAKSLAPEYTETDPDGKKQDRATLVPMMKAQLAQVTITGCATKISSIEKSGDVYVLNTEQTIDGTLAGQGTPIHAVSTQKDSWKLANGTWMETATVTTENTVSVNGNVVQHQGGAASPSPAPSTKP